MDLIPSFVLMNISNILTRKPQQVLVGGADGEPTNMVGHLLREPAKLSEVGSVPHKMPKQISLISSSPVVGVGGISPVLGGVVGQRLSHYIY